jgi:hypothetical protein
LKKTQKILQRIVISYRQCDICTFYKYRRLAGNEFFQTAFLPPMASGRALLSFSDLEQRCFLLQIKQAAVNHDQ